MDDIRQTALNATSEMDNTGMEAHGGADLARMTAAALAGGAANAPAPVSAAALANATRVVPGPDGVVTLPAGTTLDVAVSGRDLVIRLADGSALVVVDGAVFVPRIVVGDVEFPSTDLASLLIGQEPKPAAGAPTSSGGNFEAPEGTLGDPNALLDLLPPTELAFPEAPEEELIPLILDREPEVLIQPDGTPAAVSDAVDSADEAGLPAQRIEGALESPGSDAASNSETTTGVIFVTALDGLASITINGVVLTGVAGQEIETPNGVLVVSALVDGQITYTYTLRDNTNGDATSDLSP